MTRELDRKYDKLYMEAMRERIVELEARVKELEAREVKEVRLSEHGVEVVRRDFRKGPFK